MSSDEETSPISTSPSQREEQRNLEKQKLKSRRKKTSKLASGDKNEDLVLEKTQSVTKKRKNTTELLLITYKRRKQNKEKAQKVVSNDTSYPYFPYTVLAILYANECDKRKRTTELEEDENVELEKFTYKMFTKIEEELVLELFEDKTKGSEKVGKKKKKRKDTTGKKSKLVKEK
ncbi:hypothetical protein QVD17_34731 [Tagetes erecta]|uniref:Uncharacterized protein n=1 Tax=Tagetes erecta TaxID=13708 RepID=A0AAD8NKK4_TARER|nr:hypothetical protein QVD17_34731 [Tagetes erecta]